MTATYRIVTWRHSRWNWWARIERPRAAGEPPHPHIPLRRKGFPDVEAGWRQVSLSLGATRGQANRKADRKLRELRQEPDLRMAVRIAISSERPTGQASIPPPKGAE